MYDDLLHPTPRLNLFSPFTSYSDGIDGKQARRTGTSGPLGELFDHGVDSYSAALIPIYMFSIFGTDAISPTRMHFVTWNVFLNFFLTHFEKYNTGVMYLPWAYDFTMWVRNAFPLFFLFIHSIYVCSCFHLQLFIGILPCFEFNQICVQCVVYESVLCFSSWFSRELQ